MSAHSGPNGKARLIRTLTFWLRPAFALRVVNRFQKIIGFDRSMALASSALTALIPLVLLLSSILGGLGRPDLADWMVRRYRLTGSGASAVQTLFSFENGESTGLNVLGSAFLVISALSFARTAQRLIEQTWELPPLSVRNTVNQLRWLPAVLGYLTVVGWLHAVLGHGRLELTASLCQTPVTAAFLLWSGRTLSARRQDWASLVPFAVLGGVLNSAYAVGTTLYLPRLFSSYATRYGPVGAVFAMITTLFGAMLVVVGSAALGREVVLELDRIRSGQRPPEDEVRREWDNVISQARRRWESVRKELAHRRRSSRSP